MTSKELKQNLIDLCLCIDNIYLDKYVKIIIDNLYTIKQYGYDKHHIIPKYYYKYNNIKINNSKNNLVNLSRSEHILAHLYLCFCSTHEYFKYSNAYAVTMLINRKLSRDKNYKTIITYELEDFIKEHSNELDIIATTFSKLQSKRYKGKPQNISEEAKERKRQKIIEKRKNYKPTLNKIGIRYNNSYFFVSQNELNEYLNKGAIIGRGPHSKEAIEKNRQSHLGKSLPHNRDWNIAISNGNKGKVISKETREKISKSLKGNKEKCGKNRGKICINNSKEMKYVTEEEYESIYIKQGWIKGRIKNPSKNSIKGKIRINNETCAKYVTLEDYINIYSKEGWHRGYDWKK